MDKQLVYIITTVVCIVLQLALAPAIQIMGARPDFLLIPVLFIALRSGAGTGAIAGFVFGLVYDFAGDGVIGAMSFTYCLIALIVGALGRNMELSPLIAAVIGLIFSFICELVYGMATVLGSVASSGVFSNMMGYALPCGLYTAVICAVALLTMSMASPAESPQIGGGLGFGGNRSIFS